MSAFKSFLDVRRKEIPFVLSMFMYFFLVITIFWILKPIKKSYLVSLYSDGRFLDLFGMQLDGSEAELIAKVGNMVVAAVATIVFTLVSRKLHRHRLTYVFAAFSAIMLAYFAVALDHENSFVVWAFYLFGDLFNTLMVATFFAFLNDSVAPEDSKRLYGPIVLGGLTGGMAGSVGAKALDQPETVWMVVAIVLTGVIAIFATIAGRWVERNAEPAVTAKAEPAKAEIKVSAFDGFRLVAKSRYLLAIVVMVALYEIISTILDYQFTATVVHYITLDNAETVKALGEDAAKKHMKGAIGEQFATVYAITNTIAFFIQIFLTSVIMKRAGIRVALLVMPLMILGNSAIFLALPILWVGSFLSTTDNALNYSLNQSAKESLYTVTTREEKYAAKAVIDMFVQRFAKAIAVFVALGVGAAFPDFAGVRWLSIIVLVLGAGWLVSASYAGRRFRELSEEVAKTDPPKS